MNMGEKLSTFFDLIKAHYKTVFLVFLAVIFFFAYSYLSLSTPERFNSPDETANYFFSKNLASTGQIQYPVYENNYADEVVHPRSILAKGGYLVPGSFIGLIIIYGLAAKILGIWIIKLMTPLFSVIAVLCFYGIIRRVFSTKVGFIAAILMFFHPIYWYYSARSMMPNVLFIDCLIIALYLIQQTQIYYTHTRYKFVKILAAYVFSGFFLGLALSVRPSEVYWIFIACVMMLVLFIKRIYLVEVIIFLLIMFLTLMPTLYYNNVLYGSMFSTGYNVGNFSTLSPTTMQDINEKRLLSEEEARKEMPEPAVEAPDQLTKISEYLVVTIIPFKDVVVPYFSLSAIFPFGFDWQVVKSSSRNYLFKLLWPWAGLMALGIVVFFKEIILKKAKRYERLIYFSAFLLVSAYLIIYYGSWSFQDNINGGISIGTSYTRYWLPIYLMSLPFVALVFTQIMDLLQKWKIVKVIAGTVLLIPLLVWSVYLSVWGTGESLLNVKENILEYERINKMVLEKVEEDAIIMVDRADKIFFPQRQVVVFMMNYEVFKPVERLTKFNKVYYYTLMPPEDIQYINERKIPQHGLRFELQDKFENTSLYRLLRVD